MIFSFPMLVFMVGTAHFFVRIRHFRAATAGIYWAITSVIWIVLELNCLGIIGGTGQNITNWIYENHKRAIGTALVLTVRLVRASGRSSFD